MTHTSLDIKVNVEKRIQDLPDEQRDSYYRIRQLLKKLADIHGPLGDMALLSLSIDIIGELL